MKQKSQLVFWAGLIILVLFALLLRGALLHNFPLSADEGIHLMWLRLLSAGYLPYSEVYITYPPLYPLTIDGVWRVWPTETAQRWFSVTFAVFGAVGVALIGRKFAGVVAGLSAAALVLFSAILMEPSVAILGEFHAVAWAVWAVWFAWLYRATRRGRPALALLSGLCLSASLLTKLLLPFVAVLIPLLLLTAPPADWPSGQPYKFRPKGIDPAHLKPLLRDVVLWSAALLLPAMLLIFFYDAGSLVQQVVGQRLKARVVYMDSQGFWPPRLEYGAQFWQEDALLVLLALAGAGGGLAAAIARSVDFVGLGRLVGGDAGSSQPHSLQAFSHFDSAAGGVGWGVAQLGLSFNWGGASSGNQRNQGIESTAAVGRSGGAVAGSFTAVAGAIGVDAVAAQSRRTAAARRRG